MNNSIRQSHVSYRANWPSGTRFWALPLSSWCMELPCDNAFENGRRDPTIALFATSRF